LWDFDNPVHTCKAFELGEKEKAKEKKQLKVQEGRTYMLKQFTKQGIGCKNPIRILGAVSTLNLSLFFMFYELRQKRH